MDWLNRAWLHTVQRFRALPPNAQFASIAVVAVVVIAAAVLARKRPDPDYVPLFDQASFSSAEVIQMTAALRKGGLKESRIAGRQILVPRDSVDDYLVALHKADALPGDLTPQADAPLGFNPFASREHIQRAQSEADKRKLERILTGMTGIESASVQYTQVKKPGFPPVEETRAVVAVRMCDGRHLGLEEVETIRDTATAYVAGLERQQVTVTDLNAFHAYPGSDAGLANNYSAAAVGRLWESDLQTKIERQLSMVPGVIVGVTAHFEEPSWEPTEAGQNAASPRPVLVTASIGIPDNYCRLVWRQRNPAANQPVAGGLEGIEDEVAQNIERAVAAILPTPAIGWETDQQVQVTTYEMLASATEPALAATGEATFGFSMIIGLLLALGAAVAVWWAAARRNASATVPPSAVPHTDSAQPADTDQVTGNVAPTIQTELQQAVEKDPDAAAKLLNQWLRDAA